MIKSDEQIEVIISQEVQRLIKDLSTLRDTDLEEFKFIMEELVRDMGQEFYDKYLKQSLEKI